MLKSLSLPTHGSVKLSLTGEDGSVPPWTLKVVVFEKMGSQNPT